MGSLLLLVALARAESTPDAELPHAQTPRAHAEKVLYDFSMLGAVGFAPQCAATFGTERLALRARVTPALAIDGSVRTQKPCQSFIGSGYGTFRSGLGATWTPLRLGLHGAYVGGRVVSGPESYHNETHTFCDLEGCHTVETPQGWQTALEPNIGIQWVGHPGITLAFEIVYDIPIAGDSFEGESLAGLGAFASVGWAFAVGEPVPTRREALADLSPEQREKREHQARDVRTGTVIVLGGVVVGFAVLVVGTWIAYSG